MYAGCPLNWSNKLQTEKALSTKESGYIALSQAMQETITAPPSDTPKSYPFSMLGLGNVKHRLGFIGFI